jgi:PAT family beta-lactamase induction signal transducer AmpG
MIPPDTAERLPEVEFVPISALKGLFDRVPPESYATAMEKSQVTAAALGTGYMVFYLYSTAIGVFSIALSFMVAARQGDLPKPADEDEPASA